MENQPPKEITRRSFLTYGIAILGGAMAAVLGGIGAGNFLSPLWRKKDEGWVDLGPAANFAENVPLKVDFTARKRDAWATIESKSSAWVVTANKKDFIAYDPKCTHLGCPYRWDQEKKEFICPCHTAHFAIDGQVISGPPPRALDRYATKVSGGHVFVMPQTAKV